MAALPALPTSVKIKVARVLRQSTLAARRLLGHDGTRVVCTRNGLQWELDLNEGIDLSLFLLGRFEVATTRRLRRLLAPGMVTVDIGANVGAHALPMAAAVGSAGRVYALEPTAWAFERLKRNLALNPRLAQVVVPEQCLLGAPESKIPDAFYASWQLSPGATETVHALHGGAMRSTAGAALFTLDRYVAERGLSRLDVIKIDVDGWECAVFRGAARTLERFGPAIVLELAPYQLKEHGGSLAELVGLLANAGYELRSELLGRPLPRDPETLAALISKAGSINALAVRP